MFTPDNSFTCINCGKQISGPGGTNDTQETPMGAQRSPMKKQPSTLNATHFLMIVVVVAVLVLGYFILTKGSASTAANAAAPGEETDIEDLVQTGSITIFDFYSDYCPPCRKISPLLEKLDEKREDIVVMKIDINREGRKGIDWGSPLARQYGLRSIPHFVIYDESGERSHEGKAAAQQVFKWLMEEGIEVR
jgi:thiol-disulfide isomerase/thioredoxin